ncbi:MAG: family 78 glycoside hydrolase catalytic domain [Clostridia bacterium]|nr:family 78 glycoside hydrolase catalytic domain [Clostridia bacterium]
MRFEELFGEAAWVQADAPCVSPEFRAVFDAEAGEAAQITVCGLGFFELFLNGRRVSDDLFVPANSHYHAYADCFCAKEFGEEMTSRIYAVRYDLSAFLQDGENELTVAVGPGWYFRYGACRLCFRITLPGREIVSGRSVGWRPGTMTAYELTHGETHDFTLPVQPWRDVTCAELPDTDYQLQDCPADRVIRSVVPRQIAETPTEIFYDVGENLTGRPVLRCAEAGAQIAVRTGEAFDAETCSLPERRAHKQVCSFRCDGTAREYYPRFTWCAGQYFAVRKPARMTRFDEIHADVPVTSAFRSSSAQLNWFYDAFVRTQLSNMHAGIPSDCPHLERRGYTGDGQLVCEAAMLLLDSRTFYRKWMRDVSDCQDRKSGHVQYTAPYVRSGGGPGGWGCAIVEVPYVYYKVFGDAGPFRTYYPQMLRWFDYLNDHSENDLVVRDQPEQWCLGEWCVPGQKQIDGIPIPNPFVNTYFFIRSIDRLLEMAPVIGSVAQIPALRELRARKAKALVDAYFDPETGDFAADGNGANAFALDVGLGDERTLRNLVAHVRALDCVHTGIFGTDVVPRILFENGFADLAYRFLTFRKQPSFGYMRACGATTLWEEWNDPRSMSHPMFGAAVRYLFQYILGVRQTKDSCGFAKVVIDPADIPDLTAAQGRLMTVRGTIAVDLCRKSGTLKIQLPHGIEAVCRQDGADVPLHAGVNIVPLHSAHDFFS